MTRDLEYLIGLDLGTSAIKGVLIFADGTVISREKEETEYFAPYNGWTQFDAEKFYLKVAKVIHKLVSVLPEHASIAGISMASASGNTLLVDGRGKSMIPAFSWMDTRVTDEMEQVFGVLKAEEVHELVGWPLLKMFPLAHLSWLKCHQPGLLENAAHVCISTDYVNYRLTGEWGIDRSTATTFYLQDQTAAKWHAPFLKMLEIPEWKLPSILSSGTILGSITPEAAADTGLPRGTPVILGAFDHPCAAIGAGVLDEGQLLISCGTSWVGFYPFRDRRRIVMQEMLTDPFLHPKGSWGAMFSLPAAANKVDRYIRQYISNGPERYREFDVLAASAGPGAGGLLINPYHEESSAEIRHYGRADIARALMEGMAFCLKMQIEKQESSCIRASSVTMVGGPSETHPWPQIVCDILGLPITTVNGLCAGAVGAAIMAGIGVGLYTDVKDANDRMDFPRIIREPSKEVQRINEIMYCNFKKWLQGY